MLKKQTEHVNMNRYTQNITELRRLSSCMCHCVVHNTSKPCLDQHPDLLSRHRELIVGQLLRADAHALGHAIDLLDQNLPLLLRIPIPAHQR